MVKIIYSRGIVNGVVFVVVFALVALVMISGCNGDAMGDDAATEAETNGIEETAAEEPRGNTPGNINQGGFVAASDGWVYFTIPNSDDNRLFKMRSDGTDKQVLIEEDAATFGGIEYINVITDWIYYTSDSDIVKVRTDGSERIVIEPSAGAMYLNVVGDWIYYSAARGGIYKIRVDGEDKTELHDAIAHDINVFGNWIYFSNWDDDRRPYKISLDGSESDRVTGVDIFDLQYYDGKLYYITDNMTISRISVDGGRSSEVDEHPISPLIGFIIDEGWIYHIIRLSMSEHFSLIRLDPDSGGVKIIQELEMFDDLPAINSFNIADGWVYIYASLLDSDFETIDEAMFRVRTDGNDLERVIDLETEIESAAHAE